MSDVEPSALAAVLAGEDSSVRRAVQLVGQILTGSVTTQVTLAGFLHAMLGRSGSDLVCESRRLSSIGHVAAGLALAALIDRFDPPIGPSDDDEPPTWAHIEIGDKHLAPPARLSAFFTAGQLAPAPVVVRLSSSTLYSDTPRLQVYTTPADRGHAVAVIEAIMTDADGAKNLYRGRALTASENNGLVLEVTDIPTLSRTNVVVPESVWEEIDLNIAALTTHRQLMTQLGLGVRRGILLAGPPGVGKTAISQTIAAELVGPFTVINVDARAGKSVLSAVYKEARALGPTVIVLEDIDLIVGNRRHHGEVRPLSEFLAVMDTDPSAPILMSRPGMSGDSRPWEDSRYGTFEQVPR
ncbi:AAA family ATPase [Mycobacterium avium]|uniref:AAA family ATPase n=1 Tax=Mycobacterium avium TaxID=1764 RepID=UPI0020D09566|nr:ATP-binding protein [Mycobacterium avium]